MKAALALVFFACIAGSMAQNTAGQLVNQLGQQLQGVAVSVLENLRQTLVGIAQEGLGQLQSLVGSLDGRSGLDFQGALSGLKDAIQENINKVLGQLLGGLSSVLGGGRGAGDLVQAFNDLLKSLTDKFQEVGKHVFNQGLASVLGGLGSLGGSRGVGDAFAEISQKFADAINAAKNTFQGAVQGALGSITELGSNLKGAAIPHWEQLRDQLTGHGLNVLGSISENINNLHSSITGGR